jgi:uracil-DNA glycosylase
VSRSAPTDLAPPARSLGGLAKAAQSCKACPLYARATQAVFGEGPANARIVLVGEQPGDVEDRKGHPFVGPAGAVLDRALDAAGIDRRQVYLTNAVKHFSWEPANAPSRTANGERGKRRIHKKPRASEVKACRPWLDAELSRITPAIIVCLGATAVQSLLGPTVKIGASRDQVFETPHGRAIVTRHPSSILRAIDKQARQSAFDELVAALRGAVRLTATPSSGR